MRNNVVAGVHGMTDERWKRHANPWSVWTRFAMIPAFELAVWSRDWISWWSVVPIAAVIFFGLVLNVRVFGPVEPVSWVAEGIYGEQLHVKGKAPRAHTLVLRWLIATGLGGFAVIAWGLVDLSIWPVALGTVMVVMAQLWRIDRYGLLFEQHQHEQTHADRRRDAAGRGRPDGAADN